MPADARRPSPGMLSKEGLSSTERAEMQEEVKATPNGRGRQQVIPTPAAGMERGTSWGKTSEERRDGTMR